MGSSEGAALGDLKAKRSPKALVIVAALIALLTLAIALPRLRPSEIVDVRLSRLLLTGDERQGTLNHTAKNYLAEFRFEVPSGKKIWLTDQPIGVETLQGRKGWTLTGPNIDSAAQPKSGTPRGRTISRTIWLAIPADVKRCRFTIGFRYQTPQEAGMGLLDKLGGSRRFPAVSGWIVKHLPNTERWLAYRREVPVTGSSIKPMAVGEYYHILD